MNNNYHLTCLFSEVLFSNFPLIHEQFCLLQSKFLLFEWQALLAITCIIQSSVFNSVIKFIRQSRINVKKLLDKFQTVKSKSKGEKTVLNQEIKPWLTVGSISAAFSSLVYVRGRSAGSFPEQRLVIEPRLTAAFEQPGPELWVMRVFKLVNLPHWKTLLVKLSFIHLQPLSAQAWHLPGERIKVPCEYILNKVPAIPLKCDQVWDRDFHWLQSQRFAPLWDFLTFYVLTKNKHSKGQLYLIFSMLIDSPYCSQMIN